MAAPAKKEAPAPAAPGAGAPAAAKQAAAPVSDEQALYLIRSTLSTLSDANRSGNYSVLRDLAAPDFQARNTAAGPISCPVCGTEMATREYGYASQVVIDTCPAGCGVWLDAGEIQALEKFFERAQQSAGDLIPLRWRLWASIRSVFERD